MVRGTDGVAPGGHELFGTSAFTTAVAVGVYVTNRSSQTPVVVTVKVTALLSTPP